MDKDKSLSRVFELINTSGQVQDLSELRLMAAQQGADTLLLVRGASQMEGGLNAKALSYIALVPMFFVEGNNVQSSFVTQAVLWDVRKPFVHLGVETEGDWSMERPLVFRQKERALTKSKEESLHSLSRKLNSEMNHLRI